MHTINAERYPSEPRRVSFRVSSRWQRTKTGANRHQGTKKARLTQLPTDEDVGEQTRTDEKRRKALRASPCLPASLRSRKKKGPKRELRPGRRATRRLSRRSCERSERLAKADADTASVSATSRHPRDRKKTERLGRSASRDPFPTHRSWPNCCVVEARDRHRKAIRLYPSKRQQSVSSLRRRHERSRAARGVAQSRSFRPDRARSPVVGDPVHRVSRRAHGSALRAVSQVRLRSRVCHSTLCAGPEDGLTAPSCRRKPSGPVDSAELIATM